MLTRIFSKTIILDDILTVSDVLMLYWDANSELRLYYRLYCAQASMSSGPIHSELPTCSSGHALVLSHPPAVPATGGL